MAGKADWLAHGLPSQGEEAGELRAGDIARTGVPTCQLDERLEEVRERVQASGWDHCIVVNDRKVVLGRLRGAKRGADPAATVEAIMEDGPTTIRPSTSLASITERMRARHVSTILVTTSSGRLLGVLYRADAEQYLPAGEPS